MSISLLGNSSVTHTASHITDWTKELFDACISGDFEKAKNAIGARVNINSTRIKKSFFPLFLACQYNHLEIVKLLLDNGAEIEAKIWDRKTSLHLACEFGHLEIVKLLLDRGANIEAKNLNGETPLHFACRYHKTEITKELLNKGADIYAVNRRGGTPLHLATDIFECTRLVTNAFQIECPFHFVFNRELGLKTRKTFPHPSYFQLKDKLEKTALDNAKKNPNGAVADLIEAKIRKLKKIWPQAFE